jgi:hypothetical protein
MCNSVTSFMTGLSALMAMATPCYAQPRSVYEQHQEQSDYVVIAKAREQKEQLGFDNIPIETATFDVMSVLKGKIQSSSINVIVKSESAEQTASCCEPGKIYLIYLLTTKRGFELIRGRDGIFLLEKLHFSGNRRSR